MDFERCDLPSSASLNFGRLPWTKKEFTFVGQLHCQNCNNTAQWKLGEEAN
ncbi:MAG: hypothetical protein R2750_00590 [Bacteroidales bacterium]